MNGLKLSSFIKALKRHDSSSDSIKSKDLIQSLNEYGKNASVKLSHIEIGIICKAFDINRNQDITVSNIQKVLKITLNMSKEEKILSNHPVFPSWLCDRKDFKTYYNNNIKSNDDSYNIIKIELLLNSKPEERSLSDLQILMKWLKLKNILTKVKQGRLLEVCKQLHLLLSPIGSEVIKQGEPGDAFYIILDGNVDVLVDNVIVARLRSGNIFGEKALDNDAPRAATVKTASNCKLMMLTASEYKNLIQSSHARIINELSSFFHSYVSLFSQLSIPRIKNLVKLMVTLPFKDEQIIIEQGKIGGGLCIVKSGYVAIVRKILNDQNNYQSTYSQGATIIPVIVSILSNGSIFGDDSFRFDNRNKYSAVALGPVEIIIFNKKDVLNYLDKKICNRMLSSTLYLHTDDNVLLQKYFNFSRRRNYYNTLKNEACGKSYIKRKYISDMLIGSSNESRLLSNKSYENLNCCNKNNYTDTIAQDKFNENDEELTLKVQTVIFKHDYNSRQGNQGSMDIFVEAENVARRSSFCQRRVSNHDIYARRGSVRRISVGNLSEMVAKLPETTVSTVGRRNSINMARKNSIPFLPTIISTK